MHALGPGPGPAALRPGAQEGQDPAVRARFGRIRIIMMKVVRLGGECV
jgi:hypothetical protein